MNKMALCFMVSLTMTAAFTVGCSSSSRQAAAPNPVWADGGPTGQIRVISVTADGKVNLAGQSYDDLDAFKQALSEQVEKYPSASTVLRVPQGQEQSAAVQEVLVAIRAAGVGKVYQAIARPNAE